MAPLNLFETRDLLTPAIASCNISLYYYGGFCYLMQRRYLDAARAFNSILAFIHRCVSGACITCAQLSLSTSN